MRRTFALLFVASLAASQIYGQFPPASTYTNAATTNVPTAFTPNISVPRVATVTVPQAANVPIPQAVVPTLTTALPPSSDGMPRTTPSTPRVVVPPQATAPTAQSLMSQQLPKVHAPAPAPPPPLGNTASLTLEQPTMITNADGSIVMPLTQGLTNTPRFSPSLWEKTNPPAADGLKYHW